MWQNATQNNNNSPLNPLHFHKPALTDLDSIQMSSGLYTISKPISCGGGMIHIRACNVYVMYQNEALWVYDQVFHNHLEEAQPIRAGNCCS